MELQLKRIVFRHHLSIALGAFIVLVVFFVGCLLSSKPCEINMVIAAVGGLASFVFFVQRQQLDELHLFTRSFKEFNGRYNGLNAALHEICRQPEQEPLSAQEQDTLDDYFNLCGEEYLFYTKGYIEPEVWRVWNKGIRDYLKNPRISAWWSGEQDGDSYYGLRL